jgi:hypothetical protein
MSLQEIPLGAMRFNSDSQKLEYFNGEIWMQVHTFNPDLNGGVRALTGGGYDPAAVNMIQGWNIATAGSNFDFGNLTEVRGYASGASSRTRAVFAGGGIGNPNLYDTIDYVTFASFGDAIAFGELANSDRWHGAGASNETRGLFAGGENPTRVNEIDYITIATTGDAKDFGDLTRNAEGPPAVNSPTRAVFCGGVDASPVGIHNTIDYVTIATTGNAQDFGDLSQTFFGGGASSNAVRGLVGGGATPSNINNIESLYMATLGNATNFGDLTVARRYLAGCASSTRMTWGGGLTPAISDVIDYVSFATEGNAVDFGDLNDHMYANTSGVSNGHGGLG